ncbi:hypothetical protein BD410DRAFT_310027 [Rickenella mellea]|uniref:F-box domain-containing protein n=1 Tax=Rickenella mellea TaxID=50990 RepID=A0A4Y7Q1P5_9AGAM|nr:hypothetical protein BD410DRAFT_310027 [Rickenella mellea]
MFEKPYRANRKVLFCDLPNELLVKILLNLDGYSLLQAQLTNVRLRRLVTDERAVQYSLELSIAGMEDGPQNAPFSVDERMARLKDYVSAWEGLCCSGEETFTVRQPCIWTVTGGLISCAVFSPKTGTTKLVFRKLSSRTRCIDGQTWIHELPNKVEIFNADLSQDLFVFGSVHPRTPSSVSLRIGFYHISTGESHMNANCPFIEHEVPFKTKPNDFEVLICLSSVAISCKESIDEEAEHSGDEDQHSPKITLFIYDWHTGELIFQITDYIQCFSFLSHKDVLLTATPKATPSDYMLVVVDLTNRTTPNQCFVSTTLLLPESLSQLGERNIYVHSRPWFTPMGGFTTSDRVPFRTAPESRLVTITFQFHHRHPLVFCVPLSTFQNFMNIESREVSRLSECVEQGIPWEEWGPKGSTTMTNTAVFDACYTWGSRCIFWSTSRGGRIRSESIVVRDFNPLSVKRRLGINITEGQRRGATHALPFFLYPNTVSNGVDFVEDDTAALPHWEEHLGISDAKVVLMLEDHLVFVHGGSADVDHDFTFRVTQIS